MLDLILVSPLALFIGYRVGLQNRWLWWHGPMAAVIVIPVALFIGFNATLSVTAPLCLAVGFIAAQWVN